jgi:hypothetical protein
MRFSLQQSKKSFADSIDVFPLTTAKSAWFYHHFAHYVQNQIAGYLRSISCDVDVMDAFCDGCASQYKSRHCLGDLSNSFREFGYRKQ